MRPQAGGAACYALPLPIHEMKRSVKQQTKGAQLKSQLIVILWIHGPLQPAQIAAAKRDAPPVAQQAAVPTVQHPQPPHVDAIALHDTWRVLQGLGGLPRWHTPHASLTHKNTQLMFT